MKRSTILLIFLLSISFHSKVDAWPVEAKIIVLNNQVTAVVYNRWEKTIVCNGQLSGKAESGYVTMAWMNSVRIKHGMNSYVYLNNENSYNPFAQGWADIDCVNLN